eukprot:scaffold6933_cov178-Amphora_coffeaeformis.AAC.7
MISHRLNRWTWGAFASILLTTLQVSQGGGGSVSKKPYDQPTDKPKIQMLQSYSIAYERDNDDDDKVVQITQEDGICRVGELAKDSKGSDICKVHPLAVSYMKKDKDFDGFDVWAAVSLDEGKSWKRINLSHNVKSNTYEGRKCFTGHSEEDGDDSHGSRLLAETEGKETFEYDVTNYKPMIVAKKDKILVAWTGTNCKGGVPGGDETQEALEDKFQVKGNQNCHDYAAEGVDMGQVPFSCVLAARGQVKGDGEIIWTKPERITSGRRDAAQLVAQVAGNGMVWALAWQEDPQGLRVGEAEGPGDGMSGATVNHKTDIWYSYLTDEKFAEWSDTEGNTADEGGNRKSINADAAFTSPIRVTDNAACKKEKDAEEGDLKGGDYCKDYCDSLVDDPVYSEKEMLTCKTKDGILLNGDTGASRVSSNNIAILS